MKAMVLAAGKGERFQTCCNELPKPMVKVAGRPVLEHVIGHIRKSGIHDIIINLHHSPKIIRGYFGEGGEWGVSIRYSFEPELLGTAGAVKKVGGEFVESFMVYYGDNLCSCDLRKLREFHASKGGVATIVVAESYDEILGGVIEFDPDGRLISLEEKPASCNGDVRWENGGIYILEPEVLNYIPENRRIDFAGDTFLALLKAGERIYCYEAEGYVRGIDTPERYERVKREIEEGRLPLR